MDFAWYRPFNYWILHSDEGLWCCLLQIISHFKDFKCLKCEMIIILTYPHILYSFVSFFVAMHIQNLWSWTVCYQSPWIKKALFRIQQHLSGYSAQKTPFPVCPFLPAILNSFEFHALFMYMLILFILLFFIVFSSVWGLQPHIKSNCF